MELLGSRLSAERHVGQVAARRRDRGAQHRQSRHEVVARDHDATFDIEIGKRLHPHRVRRDGIPIHVRCVPDDRYAIGAEVWLAGVTEIEANGSGDRLYDITIYDKGQTPLQRTIVANKCKLEFMPKQVKFKFTLFKGEIHEIDFTKPNDYRRLIFQVHTIYIPADGMMLNRRESSRRGDREMSAQMMQANIITLE